MARTPDSTAADAEVQRRQQQQQQQQQQQTQTVLPRAKHDAFTRQLLELCSQATGARSQADVMFVRDRLHERCAFFRLWPPRLQALLCQLATTRRWAANEVIVSQGSHPTHFSILIEGSVAVAVRDCGRSSGGRSSGVAASAATADAHEHGPSALKDMAVLGPGDTFGEVALMGFPRQPAFVVVRSSRASTLAVDAVRLATAMQQQQQQAAAVAGQLGKGVLAHLRTVADTGP